MDIVPDASEKNRPTGRRWLLFAIVAVAFLLRLEGLNWPRLHPDENPVGAWIARGGPDRFYAGGFFQLIRPVYWTAQKVTRLGDRMRRFRGLSDRREATGVDPVLLARGFSVWLGALTVLLVYFAARRFSGSPAGALTAAALMAFSAYAIEHAHYAETDTAMVFLLALTLALTAQALASGRRGWWGAMALAAGFAAGTKYTLVLLLPTGLVALAVGLAPTGATRGRRLADRARSLLVWTALFLVGFVLANPAVFDWSNFVTGFAYEKGRLLKEMQMNLGANHGDASLRWLSHSRSLLGYGATLGLGWLALAAAGVPLLARRGMRRAWPMLLLFPLLYTAYWIFGSPWVRSQEFMNYLPPLALLAALPITALDRLKPRFPARTVGVILAAVAVGMTALHGMRTASIFGWKDTRLLAQRWMERCAPEARYAQENYAKVEVRGDVLPITSIVHVGMGLPTEWKTDYMIGRGDFTGRGMMDPRTGTLYPAFEEQLQEFLASSERLGSWGLLPPRTAYTTFNSVPVELYRFRPANAASPDLPLTLPRPYLLSEAGRETFFPTLRGVGSYEGLALTPATREIAVGGPDELTAPVYAICTTGERGTAIRLRGFGERRSVLLGPYDAIAVPLQRAKRHGPRWGHFEKIRLTAEPEPHVSQIPAQARIAFDRAEAARMLLDAGRADRARQAFPNLLQDEGIDPMLRYRLAVETGDTQAASALEQAAVALREQLAAVLGMSEEAFRLQGRTAAVCQEFARCRVPGALNVDMPRHADAQGRHEGLAVLPVRVPPGRYVLSGEVESGRHPIGFQLTAGASGGGTVGQTARDPRSGSCYSLFRVEFDSVVEQEVTVRLRTTERAELVLKNLTLRWDLREQLRREGLAFDLARAENALAQGENDAASAILAQDAGLLPPDLERRRAALLRRAETEDAVAAPRQVFAGWLGLHTARFDPASGEGVLHFSSRRGERPPLRLTFWKTVRNRRVKLGTFPLADADPAAPDVDACVAPFRLDLGMDLEDVLFSLEADVPWKPGTLETHEGETHLPLSDLLDDAK